MASFIENINALAAKLDIIEESNGIFDEGVVPVLEEIAALDLAEAIDDLKKGNYLGNRKIDIDMSLNVTGITAEMDPAVAEAIWTDPAQRVTYSSATVLFVDGVSIEIPFIFDGNPVEIQTHGDLLIQLNANATFLAKLEDTSIAGFSADVVGEIVRFYDVIGTNSNVERITLHAASGPYKEEAPQYYWAKTTSAFETLAMRAGDVIKLGNEIDNLILLANQIEQVIELQSRIPEFIDTYTNEVANGDLTIYNKLTELDTIYTELQNILVVYEDIKTGGTNYINTVATDLQGANTIGPVAADLNLGVNSSIKHIGSNIDNVNTVANDVKTGGTNYTNTVALDLTDANSAITEIATDLQLGATSKLTIVSTDIDNVNTVGSNIGAVDTVAVNITKVNDVVNTVIPNIDEILLADDNAVIATTKASEASASATSAANSATLASNKAAEIKAVSVASTITGTAGTNAAVTYNSADGKFTFVVPQGIKGDKGDSFEVNAVGTISQRSLYDTQQVGFSFLAIDEATIYFKLSGTSGDWSVGAPFGKGDKGDTGDTGNGIVDIAFTSTTDVSGLPAQSGATDTYTITYTDTTTDTMDIKNGQDGAETIIETVEEIVVADAASYTVTMDTTSGVFDVYLNGIRLASTDYTLGGTDLTINTGVYIDDVVSVVRKVAYATVDTYTQVAVNALLTNKDSEIGTLTNKTIDSATNFIGADHIHYKVKNMSGVTLNAGTLIKMAGYEAGEETIRVAAVDSVTDVALGMVKGTIYHGEIGLVVNTGVITGVNTTALTINQILYNAGNGSLSTTKASEEYQACAIVLKQAVDGALLVEFSEPVIDSYKKSEVDTLLGLKADQTTVDTKLNAANPSITGSITEQVSSVSGNVLEPDNGTIQTLALSADVTLTDGLADGQSMLLSITGGDTYVVAYPTTTWVDGSAPTLTASDMLVFYKIGTTLYGKYIGTTVQA